MENDQDAMEVRLWSLLQRLVEVFSPAVCLKRSVLTVLVRGGGGGSADSFDGFPDQTEKGS